MTIREYIPLKDFSHFKIGGPARFFIDYGSFDELSFAISFSKEVSLPFFILGGGTNILFPDEGLKAVVIRDISTTLSHKKINDDIFVRVSAGVSFATLLDYCATHSLSGLEWAGGLPGSVGGGVRGNAGAFHGECKDTVYEVVSVSSLDPKEKIIRDNFACSFSYRGSIYKKKPDEIITEVIFRLRPGNQEEMKKAIQEKIDYRITRQPLEYPNIGSIFKNIPWEKVPSTHQQNPFFLQKKKNDPFPVLPTAVLFDHAGFKGRAEGDAMISTKHPSFIINAGAATSREVRELIAAVKSDSLQRFDISLEEEVIVVN